MKKFGVTYFFDFLGALLRAHNLPMAIYLLLNTFLGIGILSSLAVSFFAVNGTEAFIAGVVLYFIMQMVIYSPFGEGFLRGQLGACRLPAEVAQRIDPLFAKVVERAQKVNPHLDDKITLFLKEDDSVNAAAVGRRTVILNTGALSLPNDQLAGILTHEMGHISHKDTDLLLAVTIGNGVVALAFGAIQLFVSLLNMLVGFLSRFHSILALVGMLFSLAAQLFAFLLNLFQQFWTFLGSLATKYSGRKQELRADEFAVNCGAGKGLSRVLTTFLEEEDAQIRPAAGLLARFTATHPELRARLMALADLGVPIERPELLVNP